MTHQGAITRLQQQLSQVEQRLRGPMALPWPSLMRLETPMPPLNPLRWLMQQRHPIKVFWSTRDSFQSTAAVGAADDRTLANRTSLPSELCHMESLLVGHSAARYYGGLGFDDDRVSRWPGFPYGRFVLPLIEVNVTAENDYTLACHLLLSEPGQTGQACAELRQGLNGLQFHDPDRILQSRRWPMLNRHDSLSPPAWKQRVQHVLDLEATSELKKLVLSREVTLGLGEPISPWQLLEVWRGQDENCFSFGLQFERSRSFLGCSPERLFYLRGHDLESEALAGTIGRGDDSDEDTRNTARLRHDPKAIRENELVHHYIKNRLQPLCDSLALDPMPSVLKLRRVQHLRHRLRGHLHPRVTVADILQALHPTPAVGGTPSSLALHLINELEPHRRGWYSGTVGYIGARETEFAVAIRCALLHDSTVRLYSGAGIVPGSEPEAEWQELESKIHTVLSLFE